MTAAPLPAFDAAGRCLPPRRLRQGEVHRCRWTDHSPETIVDDRLSQASASPAAGHSCQASSGIQLGSPLVGTFAQSGERLRVEAPARPSRSNAPSGRPGGGGQRLGEDRPVKTTVLPAASSSSRGGCTAPAAQYSRPALPPVPAGRVGRVGRAPDRGSAQRCCCQPLAPRIPDVAGQPQPWPQPDKLDQVDVVNYAASSPLVRTIWYNSVRSSSSSRSNVCDGPEECTAVGSSSRPRTGPVSKFRSWGTETGRRQPPTRPRYWLVTDATGWSKRLSAAAGTPSAGVEHAPPPHRPCPRRWQ